MGLWQVELTKAIEYQQLIPTDGRTSFEFLNFVKSEKH